MPAMRSKARIFSSRVVLDSPRGRCSYFRELSEAERDYVGLVCGGMATADEAAGADEALPARPARTLAARR
jgi:hypothetical protein